MAPQKAVRAGEKPKAKKKKEKEFAWMDSESDGESSDEKPTQESDEDVTAEKLDKVDSFGGMMRIHESLHKKLKKRMLLPADLAAACRASARSKFFDGELLDDLYAALLELINRGNITVDQTTDMMICSKALNYYNKEVFSAVAKAFKRKVASLSSSTRGTWFEAMQSLGHKSDIGFLQILERPPLMPTDPKFRSVRCLFFEKGICEAGSSCTYAHSNSAPFSLEDLNKEDAWRKRETKGQVLMTHNFVTYNKGSASFDRWKKAMKDELEK